MHQLDHVHADLLDLQQWLWERWRDLSHEEQEAFMRFYAAGGIGAGEYKAFLRGDFHPRVEKRRWRGFLRLVADNKAPVHRILVSNNSDPPEAA